MKRDSYKDIWNNMLYLAFFVIFTCLFSFSLHLCNFNNDVLFQSGGVTCHLCNRKFRNFQSLSSHASRSHNMSLSEESYSCHICGGIFSSRSSLKKHLMRTHQTSEHIDLKKPVISLCNNCLIAIAY